MAPLRIHIGHHFFGAGNIGDDLMIAGFLGALRSYQRDFTLSCAIPFDTGSQRIRFPEVNWLAFTPQARWNAIQACDVWLGLGDTPFQTNVGPWFLNHLMEETLMCRRLNKPMFFLGVGVNNIEAVAHPFAREIVTYARRIWTRDGQSAEYLRAIGDTAKISAGSDLAHLWLRDHVFPEVEKGTMAFVQNFENSALFSANDLTQVLEAFGNTRFRWLVQEARPLPGAERDLHSRLPEAVRDKLEIRMPDYAHASLSAMLGTWGTPEIVVSSRYHATLTALWMGCRTVIVRRSDKLAGLTAQVGAVEVSSMLNARAVIDAIGCARPADRSSLNRLADQALESCKSFFEAAYDSRRTSGFAHVLFPQYN